MPLHWQCVVQFLSYIHVFDTRNSVEFFGQENLWKERSANKVNFLQCVAAGCRGNSRLDGEQTCRCRGGGGGGRGKGDSGGPSFILPSSQTPWASSVAASRFFFPGYGRGEFPQKKNSCCCFLLECDSRLQKKKRNGTQPACFCCFVLRSTFCSPCFLHLLLP